MGALEIAIRFTGAMVKQIGRPFSLWKRPFASVLVRINNRTGQPFDAPPKCGLPEVLSEVEGLVACGRLNRSKK